MNERNGTGRHQNHGETTGAADCGPGEAARVEVLPPYEPAPRGAPPGCVIVRKEIVCVGVGMLVGAGLMYFLIQGVRDSRK